VKTRLSDYPLDQSVIAPLLAQLQSHGMSTLGVHRDIDIATSRWVLQASL
jgi:NADP-dependent alcohol dehydrogenase